VDVELLSLAPVDDDDSDDDDELPVVVVLVVVESTSVLVPGGTPVLPVSPVELDVVDCSSIGGFVSLPHAHRRPNATVPNALATQVMSTTP
jgi:hypothetical protein